MEHERMFAQQREVLTAFIMRFAFFPPLTYAKLVLELAMQVVYYSTT